MRSDGRRPDQLRPIHFELGVNLHAEGSCIVSTGNTKVYCTATVSGDLPRWRKESGLGWVTAEYRMLPRATSSRTRREGDRIKGRTAEIQRHGLAGTAHPGCTCGSFYDGRAQCSHEQHGRWPLRQQLHQPQAG